MILVLVVVVVVLLIVIGVLLGRERRSRRLKAGFGPEYDRVVAERGDQRAAERELSERRERHAAFELRPLRPEVQERYAQQWQATQRLFVDEPVAAVGKADALVRDVMRDRGYPVDDDFERRAADISVDHPVVVENYRAAQEISARATRGEASTEDLRQSMVHFRALFAELLTASDDQSSAEYGAQPDSADAPRADRRQEADVPR
jgi:hypothetical protein